MSDAVTVNVTGFPFELVHSREKSAGHVIVGGVRSTTVTSKQHDELLPEWSVAVQQTCVVPNGKFEPDAGVQAIVGAGSHTSVAVVVNVTDAPDALVQSAVMFAGQWIAGGVWSSTVTLKQHCVEALPEWSVAVQQTCVVPNPKCDPEAGTHTIVGFGSHVSVAVVVNDAFAPVALVHSTLKLVGQWIVGPV